MANPLQRNPMRSPTPSVGLGARTLDEHADAAPARRKAVELTAFFERLRQVLADRGMSQADLARELGVGEATVSEWFTRGRVPSGDVLLRLPAVLEVNGHWLLTGEGPRELPWSGEDLYVRGAADAVAQMRRHLDEVARRYGAAPGLRSIP